MIDPTTRMEGGTAGSSTAPAGDAILREVLAAMFVDCSRGLEADEQALPDAATARELQEELREFVANPLLTPDVQFSAYLADVVIADAFRNFFGDQISSPQTDAARRGVVGKIAQLFGDLAEALSVGDDAAQLAAFRTYVSDYLKIVRDLNEAWVAEKSEPGHGEPMTRKIMAAPRAADEILLDVHRSMRRSSYVLSSGHAGQEYADFDGYYLGAEGDHVFDSDLRDTRLSELVERVVPELANIARQNAVSRLAFIEKRDDGPVGMLAMMDLILYHSGFEGCIVRPDRRLLLARVKGRPIVPGERMLVVSDVATSGGTIARPAACLRQLGAVVPAAYVLLDRCQGAKEQLIREDIALFAHWNLKSRDEILEARVEGSLH